MSKVLTSVPLSGYEVLIDWFSCTFDKSVHSISDIIRLLDKYTEIQFNSEYEFIEEWDTDDPEHEDYFRTFPFSYNMIKERGYSKSLQYGHITIFYSDYGATSKGYKLSFSGQGCREFELYMKPEFTFLDFLTEVRQDYKTNITRLDIALDSFTELFSVDDLLYYHQERKIISKFRNVEKKKIESISDYTVYGNSLNFGTRKSRMFIRIYDKALEQQIDNQSWVRTELQIMSENAENTIDEMIRRKDSENYLSEIGLGILKNYLKFCELDQEDTNKSRWETAFFGRLSCVKLKKLKSANNYQNKL